MRARPAAMAVAVTGGIASGKSAASEVFRQCGAEVLNADLIARELVQPGQPALRCIVDQFGDGVIGPDGHLNRAAMRQRIFADAGQRQALEAILHPRIRAELLDRARAAGSAYVLVEIPLLAETGAYEWIDRVVVVDVPEDLQLRRLTGRDGITRDAATRALSAQCSRAQRLALADDVVVNDGSLADLTAAVRRLDARYRDQLAGAGKQSSTA